MINYITNNWSECLFVAHAIVLFIFFGYLERTGKIQWTLNYDPVAHAKESPPSKYAGEGVALASILFILILILSGFAAYYKSPFSKYLEILLPFLYTLLAVPLGFIGYYYGKRLEKKNISRR